MSQWNRTDLGTKVRRIGMLMLAALFATCSVSTKETTGYYNNGQTNKEATTDTYPSWAAGTIANSPVIRVIEIAFIMSPDTKDIQVGEVNEFTGSAKSNLNGSDVMTNSPEALTQHTDNHSDPMEVVAYAEDSAVVSVTKWLPWRTERRMRRNC